MAAGARLLVVSGPPAAGKTTIALPLARALGLPLLAKDTIKEALMDSLGAEGVERSGELGRAAFAILFALARGHLEAGPGLVLEANFARGQSEADLRPLVAASGAAASVHCWAPPDVLAARYEARAAHRHPGHQDLARIAAGLSWLGAGAGEPAGLGVPCLRIETHRPYDVRTIVDWAKAHFGDQTGHPQTFG